MKMLTATAILFSIMTAMPAHGQQQGASRPDGSAQMGFYPNGSRPSSKGNAAYFTGTVRIVPVFDANRFSQVSAGSVTFEPGARSAWHTHPLGQRLIVTAGVGWTQVEGGPIVVIRPGDVIWCPPGVRHWHGATPTTAMTHISVQEALKGKNVDWMEHVTDAQYSAGRR
jgi:quercetin dioxygenase-like cupin family protein